MMLGIIGAEGQTTFPQRENVQIFLCGYHTGAKYRCYWLYIASGAHFLFANEVEKKGFRFGGKCMARLRLAYLVEWRLTY